VEGTGEGNGGVIFSGGDDLDDDDLDDVDLEDLECEDLWEATVICDEVVI
jgi:hypothetical protein